MKQSGFIYIFILISLGLIGCKGCGSEQQIESELEGTEFMQAPVFEVDTHIYPLYFRGSSTKIPYEKFSPENALDGDEKTYWETIPGNITGEFIEWVWDERYISDIEILFSNEIFHAKVENYYIYVNDSLIGLYLPNQRVSLNKSVQKLRIEINQTPGTNKAEIPVQNDSLSNTGVHKQQIISTYSSKSAAIGEIRMWDKNKKRIPFKNIPKVRAFANSHSTQSPREFYSIDLLFDGNMNTEWQSIKNPHTILFSFPEEQIISEIIIPLQKENETNIQTYKFGLRKRKMPLYGVDNKINTLRIPLEQVLKGKNFELEINSTYNKTFPTIAEIVFFDGSKPFRIHMDSTEIYQTELRSKILNSSLEKIIDNRKQFVKEWKVYAIPLVELKENKEENMPLEMHTLNMLFHAKSNKSLFIGQVLESVYNAEGESRFVYEKYSFDGLWRILKLGRDNSEIEIKGLLKQYKSEDGYHYHLQSTQRKTFSVVLNNQSINCSEIFQPILISW